MESRVISSISIVLLLIVASISPIYAMTAKAVLEKDKDYVHFDIELKVDFTHAVHTMLKAEYPELEEEFKELEELEVKLIDVIGVEVKSVEEELREIIKEKELLRERLEEELERLKERLKVIEEVEEVEEDYSKFVKEFTPLQQKKLDIEGLYAEAMKRMEEVKKKMEEVTPELMPKLKEEMKKYEELLAEYARQKEEVEEDIAALEPKILELCVKLGVDVTGLEKLPAEERVGQLAARAEEKFTAMRADAGRVKALIDVKSYELAEVMKEIEELVEEEIEERIEEMKERIEGLRKKDEIMARAKLKLPDIAERMREKYEKLYKHVEIPVACWETPALHEGLQTCMCECLNETLKELYKPKPVYIKNYRLEIEFTRDVTVIDGEVVVTGTFILRQSFDLYGIVIVNATGIFIQGEFRAFSAVEEVDMGRYGKAGWKFTPAKAMFMDLSAFAVPLENWNVTYDPATGTTTFTLTRDISIETPFGYVKIDPVASLTVPGYAKAKGDSITAGLPPPPVFPIPVDILPLFALIAIAVALTAAVAAYQIKRKFVTAPAVKPGP